MKLLGLETSSAVGSVALLGGSEISERSIQAPRDQTQRILPLIDELLAEAGIGLAELDGIAFGRGPGSFTGLRVAAAIAQGLGLSANLPLLPVSSLAALAQRAWRTERITDCIVCIDARMGEVYWAGYSINRGLAAAVGEHLSSPESIPVPDRAGWAALGNGFDAHADALAPLLARADRLLAHLAPTAQDVFPHAMRDLENGKQTPAETALPVYLRDETAWRRSR